MSEIAEKARGIILTGLTDIPTAREHTGFAGYVLFSRNGTSVAELRFFTDMLRAESLDAPPIIAIDQEGGAVARLQDGVEPIPPMMALGAADDLELTQRAGEQTAFDLRRAGCTLDFAPVLDLALDPGNTVIGTRSFGDDPQKVAALGAAFAAGLTRGGITPCYKHFPGHGATSVDSHHALPVLDATEATLLARDLIPFAAVAPEASVFMSAHVLVPELDPQRPATLSRRIATDLLRSQLSFKGVLVTDCLEMDALADGPVESAVEALIAGADLLLFSHHLELAIAAAAAIETAVAQGRVPLERLEEAHRRVMRLREAATPPLPLDQFPPHPNVGREIGRRAVTLLRGIPEANPIASIVVSFGADASSLQREAPALTALTAPLDPTPADTDRILTSLAQSGRRSIVLTRRAHLHPAQAATIATILQRYPDAVVVSLMEPFDLPLLRTARHLLAAYGDDPPSIAGLADILFTPTTPTGHLPVSMSCC
ncbi:MAG TPA: glycoside hydrolase family 3 N-terminal domain-containing protein [Candidatus Cybelea sp.]|nr:glycoside hydrolase family 3 N-terminal domain-containing protein [Candidatus Cybelea sp.]